jgi:hypothetical protein
MEKKYNLIAHDLSTCDAILVAQYFPPFNTIASQRALRMARVLLDNFKCVYVVTLPTVDLSEKYIDRNFGKEELSNPRLRIISIPQLLDGYGIAAKPKLTHRIIGAILTRVFCSHGSDWALALSLILKRISGGDSLRLIVSTGGPFVPFWSVTNFAIKANIPCILDYRDLWSQNPRAPYLWIFRYIIKITIERWVNSRCNVITTVSEGCRLSLQAERPNLKIRTLLNTPDESYRIWFEKQPIELLSKSFDPCCLNIVLTGTVYDECTCKVLVKAMALLPTDKRKRVRLNYFGASANIIKSDFINAAMNDNFLDFGYVKKSEAVSAVKGADVLLSLVFDKGENQDSSAVLGLMTTKVFDYFLSGKPILNIGPESADVCRLAQECGYSEFHNFNFNQTRQLADFMEAALGDLDIFRQRFASARLPDFAKTFNNILNNVFVG